MQHCQGCAQCSARISSRRLYPEPVKQLRPVQYTVRNAVQGHAAGKDKVVLICQITDFPCLTQYYLFNDLLNGTCDISFPDVRRCS